LGLATVHGIVQQSGGRITVESGPGEGSAFRIYLPRVNAPLSSAVQEAHEPIPDGNETILLVEDEHSVRALMREALEQRGYTVLEAVEPADALQMIENGDGLIQLLLTDLVMPGIDGRKLAEKAVAIYPDLRVLYVSGFTNDRAITAGLLGPTVGYLQKPFNADTLTRKVRQLLDTVQVIG
jgi:CheY-like chemotaxis protein